MSHHCVEAIFERSKIRMAITLGGSNFHALGKVVHSETGVGMAIEFAAIEEYDQQILEKRIDKRRSTNAPKAGKVPSLKSISEETPIEGTPDSFVSARAGNCPKTEPAFNVQNKAHNLVLVLVIYCLGVPALLNYVSICRPSQSLQTRKRRWDASKWFVTALGTLGPGTPWKSGSLTKHWN